MAELRCERVASAYGPRAVLSELDLVVRDGTLTAILGASGSGKTTLLRAIMGFVSLKHGRIAVGAKTVSEAGGVHLAPEKRAIGYVAQEGALYPHLSVGENVGFGLSRRERRARTRVADVLELVGLHAAYVKRSVHELSGGEQRRVALARALAPRPPLVLLDEPFSGLDAGLRADTRAAVSRALAAQGTTALLVTHDQAEALSMGREVGVLREGRLVQTARPDVLYRMPVDVDVARFVGDAVTLPGRGTSGRVSCALGELRVLGRPVQGAVQVMIRPEQIQVLRAGASHVLARGTLTAVVVGRTYYGSDTVLALALDGAPRPAITARVFSHDAPETGERVELAVAGPVMCYPSAGDLRGLPSVRDDMAVAGR
jgi:iron(III) transport system ATP-binding protein